MTEPTNDAPTHVYGNPMRLSIKDGFCFVEGPITTDWLQANPAPEAVSPAPTLYPHVMLDIETMSTHSSEALVLSIGVVAFSLGLRKPVAGPSLLVRPDIARQLLMGRRVDRSTQEWWMERPKEASAHWVTPDKSATVHPAQVFDALDDFFNANCQTNFQVWANGAVFDIGNMENIVQAGNLGRKPPWRYNAVRDYRTIVQALPKVRETHKPAGNVAHDPIHDCHWQIGKLWEHAPAELLTASEVA